MTPAKPRDAFAKLCNLAGRAVAEYGMIHDGDRILLGISGGTDSVMLMHVLTRLRAHAPIQFTLHPVCIDMGFGAFDAGILRAYGREWGWDIEVVSMPGKELIIENQAEDRPCAMCSRLRRGQLHQAASRLACGRIALGHHLDDICASLLMGLFRGSGLKTMGPNVLGDGGRLRVIRPLCFAGQDLIREAAGRFTPPLVGSCDYASRLDEHGDRAYTERLIGQLDQHFQGVRGAMLRSLCDVRPSHLLDPRWLELSGGPQG